LIHRMYLAHQNKDSEFVVWGTGTPRREFLFVDDLADACLHIMKYSLKNEMPYWINAGYGSDVTIRELVENVAQVIGFSGQFSFDTKYPDGTPRKLMDSQFMLNSGWKPKVNLTEGLKIAFEDFKKRYHS